ncbi:hypothetical protein [Streptomyces sanglieri]|uniref:hypothetical protein n=1 Tax=Streptomyces sanglieri TaxID=193460 RepID=UPI0035262B06
MRPDVRGAELRRDLIRLFCLFSAPPYWAERGRSLEGRIELSRAAQSEPDGVQELLVRWNGEEFIVTEPEAQP